MNGNQEGRIKSEEREDIGRRQRDQEKVLAEEITEKTEYKKREDKTATESKEKRPPIFTIYLKDARELGGSELCIPCIKILPLISMVPILYDTSCQIAPIFIPKLNKSQTVEDIRIPNLEPLTLKRLIAPTPKLKLRSTSSISISPIYEKLEESKKVVPQIKLPPNISINIPLNNTYYIQPQPLIPAILSENKEIIPPYPDIQVKDIPQPQVKPDELSFTGDEKLFEDFDPINLIFQSKGGTLDFDKPLVICLDEPNDDSFIGAVRTICKLIYREKRGGDPKPVVIETLQEFKNELRWIKAEDMIFSVKLSEKDWKNLTPEEWERIWSRIKQLFAQGFGVIIFNTNVTFAGEHIINIIKLSPRNLSSEIRRRIAEIFWGVRIQKEELSLFDQLFDYARYKKENLLKKLEILEGGIYWDATKEQEQESNLHRQLKVFTVMLLVKKLRKKGYRLKTPTEIEELIKTEHEIGDVRADVFAEGEVFEIETLFYEDREGKKPRDKLRESFRKYKGKNVEKINIILDNPTFLRHLKTILSLRRNFRDWMRKENKTVEFYTIDIENEGLVSLNEVLKSLKEIQ